MTPDDTARGPGPAAAAPAASGGAGKPDGVARLLTLWTIVFVSMMGFGITIVPFPVVAEQFGASPFWITWVAPARSRWHRRSRRRCWASSATAPGASRC